MADRAPETNLQRKLDDHVADTRVRPFVGLVERAFGGSASRLVLRALSTRSASPEEIERIRELLDELEGDDR